jgi:hypothetical protein
MILMQKMTSKLIEIIYSSSSSSSYDFNSEVKDIQEKLAQNQLNKIQNSDKSKGKEKTPERNQSVINSLIFRPRQGLI